MAAGDTGGAKIKRGPRLKKKVTQTRPATPTPDQADRNRQPRTPPPPVKVRAYAHPQRPGPQKAMRERDQAQQKARVKRVKLREEVRQIHVRPVPSPDATDTLRSPAQKAHDQEFVAQTVKTQRVKALRKQNRGSGVRAIKAELEGRGKLAKIVTKAGEKASGKTATTTATRLGVFPAPIVGKTKLGVQAVKDVVNVPAQAIPSVYEPVAGVVEAAQGRPQRLKRVAKGIDESDFLYNVGAAGVEAATGDTKAANKRLKRAAKSAGEHPGYALLEVAGAKGTLARGAGTVARAGVLGKTLKRAASTERAPKTLEGTSITVPREWSGDVITKASQVSRSKSRTLNPEGDRVTTRDLERRVDERVSVTGTDREPFVQEFAHKTPAGKIRLLTPKRAAEVAADLQARTGHEFSALDAGNGRRVLVPKAALDRLHEHESLGDQTTLGKSMEVANDAFRRTVLTTSTSWALGNVAEGALRAGINRAGIRSYVTGRSLIRKVRELDPAKAEELVARVADGGHFSLAERLQVQDVAGKFAGTSVEPLANALHRFWKTPGPRQAAQAWHAWTEGVFVGMRALERQFQVAHLGAEVRRSPLMSDRLVKLSKAAIDDAAEGLRNTENQVKFARAVADAYGRYSGWSPSTRMLMSNYSPFLAWMASAAKFVAWTLPREHPTVTLLTTAAVNATQDQREQAGLDLWTKGGVPGFLQGSIPTDKGLVRASRFTPMGAFGDLPDTVASQVLPLYSGPIMALKGLTFSGARIKGGESEGEDQANAILAALGEWIDGTIPIVSQAKRIDQKGIAALNPLNPVSGDKKTASTPRRRRRSSATVRLGGSSSGGTVKLGGGSDGLVHLGGGSSYGGSSYSGSDYK